MPGASPSPETERNAARDRNQVLFEGLVYDESEHPARAVWIGDTGHYAVEDAGITWHVAAQAVDHAIIEVIQGQLAEQQQEVVSAMLQMLGQDDIFTKAALDASLRNLEEGMRANPSREWIPYLQFAGFRAIIDFRGNLVEIRTPQPPDQDE